MMFPRLAALGILLQFGTDLDSEAGRVVEARAHQLLEAGTAVIRLQRLVGEAQQQGLAAARFEDLVIEGRGERESSLTTEMIRCMALRLLTKPSASSRSVR